MQISHNIRDEAKAGMAQKAAEWYQRGLAYPGVRGTGRSHFVGRAPYRVRARSSDARAASRRSPWKPVRLIPEGRPAMSR